MSLSVPQLEYYTTTDSRVLGVRVWRPTSEPLARVVFLHGVTSHGGWYDASCRHLQAAGIEVHFLDRRGSGLNLHESPGDVRRWETWSDDVEVYLQKLGPDRPRMLCGISWGGKLAAAVARRRPDLVQGLGLLCPGLHSFQELRLPKRIVLRRLPSRFDLRHAKVPLDDPALFTDVPRWRAFVARDPLALREITLRFARSDVELTRFARQSAEYLRMPMLMALTGRDRIIRNRRVRQFFGRAPAVEKMLVEYPNAAHTLEFELDSESYFSDLTAWIDKVANRYKD